MTNHFVSVKSVVIQVVISTSSLVITTGLMVFVKKISKITTPPRLIAGLINNQLTRTVLFLGPSNHSLTDSTSKQGGSVFSLPDDGTVDEEWNLLIQFVDRTCLILFVVSLIIY